MCFVDCIENECYYCVMSGYDVGIVLFVLVCVFFVVGMMCICMYVDVDIEVGLCYLYGVFVMCEMLCG